MSSSESLTLLVVAVLAPLLLDLLRIRVVPLAVIEIMLGRPANPAAP